MLARLAHVPYTWGWELVGDAGLVAVTLEDDADHACVSLRDRHCTSHAALSAEALLKMAAVLTQAAKRLQATRESPAG